MDADTQILVALLAADGGFVAGSELTDALGVSRVAVWGRLEKLREQGLEIEAQRHRGYRLLSEPEELLEPLLRAYLARLGVGADLYFHPSIDSTNSEAERLLAANVEAPFMVVANEQTAGRGRQGRQWHSPQRGNLYVSFGFRPQLPPRELSLITLWFGMAVAKALHEDLRLPVKLKWPNDLLIEGRKVAGMLTEARVDADRTRDLIFGLGLNIAADMTAWPEAVLRMATTLAQAASRPLSVNHTAAVVLKAVLSAFARFVAGDRSSLLRQWDRYDALAGTRVSVQRGAERVAGIAGGIDSEGRLRLQLRDGEDILLHSGEVTIGSGPEKGS